MDSIVKRLTEIESSAAAIVDHAEEQKAALDEEYQEARRKFDEELEAETQNKIAEIREALERSKTNRLVGQTGANNDFITALHHEYDEKHTNYAQDILMKITEV
ncbi:hypothetical protein [Clostridium sp. C105KSO13]|uniref:hypothetical protein n=1 Tax=Clostridium sp. C105KSO13 TaxID=1776045 RepID=UPI0007407089|nr:hypothetical protein [Clostridium sp. C105KSO13]CUX22151.1 hypothetical protein BN3456_00554 [Clostridium sp. C105KSO13]